MHSKPLLGQNIDSSYKFTNMSSFHVAGGYISKWHGIGKGRALNDTEVDFFGVDYGMDCGAGFYSVMGSALS